MTIRGYTESQDGAERDESHMSEAETGQQGDVSSDDWEAGV